MIGEAKRAAQELRADRDTRVREREQRHDRVARPRVPEVLEPLVRRDRQHEAPPRGARELRSRLLAERAEQVRGTLQVEPRRRIRVGQQAHDQAGDHRLDSRLVDRQPHHGAQARVEDAAADLERAQHQHDDEDDGRDGEVAEGDVVRIGDPDHDQRDEIVHHDHGEHEHAQPIRAGAADEREDAERERRVGRHRGAPAVRARATRVEREVDQHGDGEPAEPGQQRQHRPPAVAQLARVELAPRLEPDHQEEEGHQAVVDPALQILGDPVAADPDREVGRPQRLVRRRVDVRPHESGDSRAEQEDRAADLRAEERPDGQREVPRPDGPADGELGGRCGHVGHGPTLTVGAALTAWGKSVSAGRQAGVSVAEPRLSRPHGPERGLRPEQVPDQQSRGVRSGFGRDAVDRDAPAGDGDHIAGAHAVVCAERQLDDVAAHQRESHRIPSFASHSLLRRRSRAKVHLDVLTPSPRGCSHGVTECRA